MKNSAVVSIIGTTARSPVLQHSNMDPCCAIALAGSEESTFRKKSRYRVVLTLPLPMKNVAVEVDGEDVVLVDASFPLTLQATDMEEEERSHGTPMYQFQRLHSFYEALRMRSKPRMAIRMHI
jgi:hypothetical protein